MTQKIEEDVAYIELTLESIKARLAKYKIDCQRGYFWPGDDEKELQAIYGELKSLATNLKL